MELKLKLLEDLKLKFPMKDVSPYGECIVVPGVDFDPDLEVELGDQGYNCINTDIGGKAVTLVQLKKSVVEEAEKVVYVPPKGPPKPVPLGSAMLNPEKRWTEEDDARLIKLWNLEPKLIISEIAGKFPKRTLSAVANELERLKKDKRIIPRMNTGSRKVKKKTPQNIIDYAIELSKSTDPAYSSRDIAEMIETRFGVKVSNVAVQNWIDAAPIEKTSTPPAAEAKGKKHPPSQASSKWRPEEDKVLVKLWNERVLIEKMTPSFPGRTEAAIRLRIQRLEKYGKIKKRAGRLKMLPRRSSVKRWSEQEERLLVKLWNKDVKVPDMLAHFPGRTRSSITMHIDVLQKAGAIKLRGKTGKDIRKGSDATVDKSVEPPVHTPVPSPPESLTDLLKQVLDALKLLKLQEESVCFESYCPQCRINRSVEDSNVWKVCPVCGEPLIVWDVKVLSNINSKTEDV